MKSRIDQNIVVSEEEIIDIAKNCANFLADKKAEDIVLLDLKAVNSYLDYFIICTANSRMHARSMVKEIERFFADTVLKSNFNPDLDSEWIVIDYCEIVVHIFTPESREYYNLERLWADAEVLLKA